MQKLTVNDTRASEGSFQGVNNLGSPIAAAGSANTPGPIDQDNERYELLLSILPNHTFCVFRGSLMSRTCINLHARRLYGMYNMFSHMCC